VQHYRRAIRLYHGDPHFSLGLARVYRQLGEERHARRALQRADVLGRNADADHRARVPLRN